MKIRIIALAVGALAIATALAGCVINVGTTGMPGMNHGSGEAEPADVAAADEMFVTGMIVHHEQAIEMADLLLGKTGADPDVVRLAERIKAAQGPEIELMKSWLADWGVDSDMPGMDGMDDMPGMDHGGAMMSDADMAELEGASAQAAPKLFLEQMIVHHQGAIVMANGELAAGRNPDVLALARRIIEDQTAEIAEMQGMLAKR